MKITDCIAAIALRGCAASDPTVTKACYNNAQAVEIRSPLDYYPRPGHGDRKTPD
jgi:hypothetical protein